MLIQIGIFLTLFLCKHIVVSYPLPTLSQLEWHRGEIMALVHFNMASFLHDGDPGCTSINWHGCQTGDFSCNSSNPDTFAPSALNISQWVDSMVAIGAHHAVLTAKHGCGFYLWDTKVKLPDGTIYPYHVNIAKYGNILSEFQQATNARGIGHGFYYSLTNNFFLNVGNHNVNPPNTLLPGQVNVTQQQFEDIAFNSVQELWTQFGNLTEIWFDGGYSTDMKTRLQTLLLETQPNAAAFGGLGISNNPVRWCGTEGGNPPGLPEIWSTDNGAAGGCPPNTSGAVWNPSAVDYTLQDGDHWFYEPTTAIRPMSDLIQTYHNSVGSNGVLELDFAISRTGQLDPKHVTAYATFGKWIKDCYGTPVASIKPPPGSSSILSLGSLTIIDRIMLQEDQSMGQRVLQWLVESSTDGVTWTTFVSGQSIGNKRIAISSNAVNATSLRLTIGSSLDIPQILNFAAFAPEPCVIPTPPSVKFTYNNNLCLISNSSNFPCPGGAANSCPVYLGDCNDPSALWQDENGYFVNPYLSIDGSPAEINIDCDYSVPYTVAKLLRYSGGSGNGLSFVSGQILYTGSDGTTMCLNGGQTKPNVPCSATETYYPNQIQIENCTSPNTFGWARVST